MKLQRLVQIALRKAAGSSRAPSQNNLLPSGRAAVRPVAAIRDR